MNSCGFDAPAETDNLTHLLNLLAAIALLVWGTQLVRTGILRVFGGNLRNVLAKSVSNRVNALVSGLGVTALVQSSTATALIVASFVGQGLMSLPSALTVMLGADIGTTTGAWLGVKPVFCISSCRSRLSITPLASASSASV